MYIKFIYDSHNIEKQYQKKLIYVYKKNIPHKLHYTIKLDKAS